MQAIHALWGLDRRLHLWAEDAGSFEAASRASTRAAQTPTRAAQTPGPPPPPHPWAATPADLVGRLESIGDEGVHRAAGGGRSARLAVWLPSDGAMPLPSPLLAAGGTGPGRSVALRPWSVPTVAFDPLPALDLLSALGLLEAALPGATVRYLAGVALFALDLAARGRVVPGIELGRADGRHAEARWLPAPARADGERLRALARAMPPACRCEVEVSLRRDPARPGSQAGRAVADVLAQAISDIVDAVARAGATSAADAWQRRSPRSSARPLEDVVRRFLDALVAVQPRIFGMRDNGVVARDLAATLAGWQARNGADQAFRTCFRLVPPGNPPPGEPSMPAGPSTPADPSGPAAPSRTRDDVSDVRAGSGGRDPVAVSSDPWSLEVLLQAADDPSLLVPAADIWRAGATALPDASFGNATGDLAERLLLDLGRACRLHPPLEPLLHQTHPARLELDIAVAHDFLRMGAPVLSEAGFGIQFPGWWKTGGPRPVGRLRARTREAEAGATAAAPTLGLDSIVDIEWEVALGGATLSAAEIRELARLKVPLLRFRGQWVELRAEDLAAAARLAADTRTGATMSLRDVVRIGLGVDGDGLGLPVAGVTAEGWLSDLLAGVGPGASEAPAATPAGFEGTLRPYQARGLSWLAFLGRLGLGACLADDMGLGKTAQVLALLAAERAAERAAAAPDGRIPATLVVCPMSIVENWRREAARFVPGLTIHVHHGADRLEAGDLAGAVAGADLVITTYGLVARDVEALGAIEWGRIVLDEAQNVKNGAARQAQAVRRLRAPGRIALTGTPVENHLGELWSIMEILNPGLLGSAAAFRRRFAIPIERYGDDEAAGHLRRLTAPFMLRRLKTDRSVIADLPDKLEMTEHCALTREQATLYQAVVDDMLERIESTEGIERRGLVLSAMLRLKQLCDHPALMLADGSALAGRSGKLERVEEIVEEILAEGDRALLFTQFAEFGGLLRTHLRDRFGREVLFLHGGTSKTERDAMVDRFGAQDGPPVFVLSLKAGGTGLNLVAANHVIHVDRWWNPAVEDQATDRAYRIGQRRNVQVRKLVCAGTLEERIAEMLESKRALADRVVGRGETWLTELSNAELRELVALSADAVAEG